jgi:hypothetical protein
MADELSAFLEQPSGENFLRLRDLVLASSSYELMSDGDDRLAELVDLEEWEEAAGLAAELMPNWLLSARVHLLMATVAEARGESEAAAQARYLARACMRGLLLAGDGSPENPYPILHAADEYDLLGVLEKEPSSHRLDYADGVARDVVRCSDGSEVWFDIAGGLERAAQTVG